MKSPLFALLLFSLPLAVPAQGPEVRWEYYVVAQDDAISSIAESGQEEAYKAWLATSRPETHRRIAELEAQDAAADSARKKIKSFISNVSNTRIASLAALDYYLNTKGKEGWELVSSHDGTLIFKRRIP